MPAIAFPSPVLPGKEDQPEAIGKQLSAHPGLQDFLDAGTINFIRVYQMTTPAGDVVTTYQEADSIEQSFKAQIESTLEVAELLRGHIKNAHGIDITAGALPPTEQIIEFEDSPSSRQPGFGFSIPLLPGKTELAKQVGADTAAAKKSDWEAFNKSLGVSRHRVYLTPTPMGDFLSVYFEAADPVAANAAFAADDSEFGKDFKTRMGEAAGQDFSQPLPPVRLVFEATKAGVAA